MAMTTKSDLVEAVVVAQGIKTAIGKIKFLPLATVENFSNTQVGSIQVPTYTYIGNADVVAEGTDINLVKLTQQAADLTIQKVGKGVNITDEAMRGGIGNPVAEAEFQLAQSITQKIEADLATALDTATLAETGTAFDYANLVKGLAKFGENADQATTIVANPVAMSTIQTDKAFVDGKLGGMEVIYSAKVPADTAYLVQAGALGLYLADDVEVEKERNIINKSTILTADALYAYHLKDASKAVKFTVSAG